MGLMDRPILFNDAMVRAILSGAKRQTRRPVKLDAEAMAYVRSIRPPIARDERVLGWCPFGVPGDRLWVREAHAPRYFDDGRAGYRADYNAARIGDVVPEPRWTPSIHMRRADSRLTLRVTDVRVERLQAITAEDAVAEGVFGDGRYAKAEGIPYPVATFADLWRDTYGPDSWASNPWVWVVSFEREVKR